MNNQRMHMSTSFGRGATMVRSSVPLDNGQIMRVAPSVFAAEKHDSRSERYAYIPTIEVLDGLRKEGFQPFMAVQSRCRDENKREFAKHMLRLRHASMIDASEANEVILLNSHDGTSSYQMVAGMLRFVCTNSLVCGDGITDIRVPHRGNITDNVIEGAFTVLDQFAQVEHSRDDMRRLALPRAAENALATAAIALRWDEDEHVPVNADQLLRPRRMADAQDHSLWGAFNRIQENLLKGGMVGRDRNGRARQTRAVTGIAQDVKLNRALWTLAEELRKAIAPVEV